MKKIMLIVFSLLFAGSFALRVYAGDSPCAGDLKKNTQMWEEVKENRNALYSILQKYSATLSKECKAHVAQVKGIRAEILSTCGKEMGMNKTCQMLKNDDRMYNPPVFLIRKCVTAPEIKASIDCRAKGYEVGEDLFGVDDKNNPCLADQEKFCKDIAPGRLRVAKCLFSNLDALSDECRAEKFFPPSGPGGVETNPCYRDILASCKDVKPGVGRIQECLVKSSDTLSAGCKSYILPDTMSSEKPN